MKLVPKELRTIVFSIVGCLLAFVVLGTEIFAWFSMSDKANLSDTSMGIIEKKQYDGRLDIIEITGATKLGEDKYEFKPQTHIKIKIQITNFVATPVDAKIFFEYISINPREYATIPDSIKYGYDYYVIENNTQVRVDYDKVVQEKYYKALRQPLTNAIQYKASNFNTAQYEKTWKYITDDKTSLTDGPNVILDKIPLPQDPTPIVKEYIAIDAAQSIEIAGSGEAFLWLDMYYDPEFYPTQVVDGKTIMLKNSNGFFSQVFNIKLGLDILKK